MDSLRVILIIIGIALIAGIYFWERTRRDEAEWGSSKPAEPGHDPLFGNPQLSESATKPELPSELLKPAEGEVGADPQTQDDLLLLHLLAPDDMAFGGRALFDIIEANGFILGEGGIYESLDEGEVLYSLANMEEPGTFEPNHGEEFETDGLVLFMHLPKNRVIARELFQQLLHVAARLAEQTGGELYDNERHMLTEERIGQIVERYDLLPDDDA